MWFWIGTFCWNVLFMLGFLNYSFLALLFQCLYIRDPPDDVIRDMVAYANNNTTLYSKYDWTCDLWQQLELASKLECDL